MESRMELGGSRTFSLENVLVPPTPINTTQDYVHDCRLNRSGSSKDVMTNVTSAGIVT